MNDDADHHLHLPLATQQRQRKAMNRDVMELEPQSDCCRIPTIFCTFEVWWTFRLIRIQIQLSFWKAHVHHLWQSAISHTKV